MGNSIGRIFEPISALWFVLSFCLVWLLKPSLRAHLGKIGKSGLSRKVIFRYFSKKLIKELPFLGVTIFCIVGISGFLAGIGTAASVSLLLIAIPLLFPTPSQL